MTDADLIAEVERRIDAAMTAMEGADVPAIVREVAEANGVPYEHLRGLCSDRWSMFARTG